MRQKKPITIETEGRDKGKHFLITELSSYEAEQWVWRLIPVLAQAGIEVSDEDLKGGFAGIAAMGAAAVLRMPYAFVKSLLDEMLPCIQYQHHDKHGKALPLAEIQMNENCQIEEVSTWFQLRKAVIDLHINPTQAAGGSKDSVTHRHQAA